MHTVLSLALTVAALIVAVPALVLFIEVLAASVLARRTISPTPPPSRGRVAVLIPAHNEEMGIRPTLDDVRAQLDVGDRVVVIADNCTDNTAAIAAASGVDVTVRTDSTKIGKSYALDWGVNHIASDPPDTVVIIDADCRLADECIGRLASAARSMNRPIQSLYIMSPSSGASIGHQVAELAWRVKNHVRPLGLNALGMPCQLMGTGMAFPWTVLQRANLHNGHIVEDLKLGLELAEIGFAPEFLPSAVVHSTFPTSAEGTKIQRRRWEHGHLALIASDGAALLYRALTRRDARLLGLALDLMVPPLSLLGFLLAAVTTVSGAAALVGLSPYPLVIGAAGSLMFAASTVLGWSGFARDALPTHSLKLIPSYVAAKVPIYFEAVLGRRVSSWIRSDRG